MSEHKRPTQCARVLQYMKDFGSITSREAINDLGVYRLASRISELKSNGFNVERKMIKVKNRYGENCSVAEYRLRNETEAN